MLPVMKAPAEHEDPGKNIFCVKSAPNAREKALIEQKRKQRN